MKPAALVTGAAGGIGQALLRALSREGFDVIGLDQVPQPAHFAGQQYLQMDLQRLVKDEFFRTQALERIRQQLPARGLNVLVNNAAVQISGGVKSLTVVNWQRALNINLLAPFLLTQGLLPELEATKGCVVNISSIHARLTKPNFVAYATSKAALSAMTRAMAIDLGGRVRVNAIEPAAIATGMLKAGFEGQPGAYAQLERCHPQGRIGEPEEVAALALSIAKGDLRFLHGACVGLDGGIGGRLHDPV